MANTTQGKLDIALADLALPLEALPDGPLLSLSLRAAFVAEPTEATLHFVQPPPASAGSTQGYSLPVSTHDGSVAIQKPTAYLAALPDINGNGYADVAVLLPEAATGKNSVYIKDSKTKRLLRTLTFLRQHIPLALAVLPDFDGNGLQEDPALAVLGHHPASGEVQVQIRSAVSGILLQTVLFPKLTAVALAALPDVNGNNTADVAVLLHDPTLGKNSASIKQRREDRRGTGDTGLSAQLHAASPDSNP
jgi:hypothetical protein